MDIRTLLTESKPVPTRRKSTLLSPTSNSTDPFNSPDSLTNSTKSPMEETFPEDIPPINSSTATHVKKVTFTLNSDEWHPPSYDISISPNDTLQAIVATVRELFALHNCGIAFTDVNGTILIITPANLKDGMQIMVNQTIKKDDDEDAHKNKKRKKSVLSASRKKVNKVNMEKEDELEAAEQEEKDEEERRERILSSEVSIDNIIMDSSRRRTAKFSSAVLTFPNNTNLESPIVCKTISQVKGENDTGKRNRIE
jgi:hypothetical protein